MKNLSKLTWQKQKNQSSGNWGWGRCTGCGGYTVIYAGFFGWGGSTKCLGGSDFSRVERNFTIGQSPKIWGNFSKMCIKFNKKLKKFWENSRKNANFSRKFFNFPGAINF